MKTKIIIVNGQSANGKTTFEKMVKDIAAEHNKKVVITSTIDIVKEFATMIGWDGSKTPKDRKFLSDLKDALTQWKDIPYQEVGYDIS